ncbi:5-azacytidine-induced protein 2 isoform X2 [Hemitrygon akajei]|uniref:5-azacytidine-induced protein 2 isoform X2 n=1 Tax=Hemitrygon akajei TaxID=2704970 RepID=UPI003BF9CD3A
METLGAEDDISILNHEEASPEATPFRYSPIAGSSGDESLGSHFALVTAYEDIKKRLKQTETENSFLKKKTRMLEERVKEQMDSVRILNEALQAKEVEILQLRSEVETRQVMDDLNKTHNSWELDKSSNEIKVHTLNQQLEILKQECTFLREELQNYKLKDLSLDACGFKREGLNDEETVREVSLQKPYQDLKREMSNLHLVTKTQAELLRKLLATHGSTKNVQSQDLLREKLELSSSGATYQVLRPSSADAGVRISKLTTTDRFQQDTATYCDQEFLLPWANSRPSPVGSAAFEESVSCGKGTIDDNSWVFPNRPVDSPSDAAFWKTGNNSGSSTVKIPVVNIRDPFLFQS